MSRPPASNKVPTKDMYWFAHGGLESSSDKCLNQRSTTSGECEEDVNDSSSPPLLRSLPERRGLTDDPKHLTSTNMVDNGHSSGPSSLEMKEERNRHLDRQMAAEERRKLLWEAEQERNDAVLRKHMEREAAIEARRNAQRSNISFAFGSSVPRNVENLHTAGDSDSTTRQPNASGSAHKEENHESEPLMRSVSPFYLSGPRSEVDQTNICCERKSFSPPCWLVGSGALIGEDVMSKSMTASVPAPRGRRKNDLMPTVPYDRTAASKSTSSGSTRKRSVSMTRLDQLAQPRRHYVEANKASSTTSSGASSMLKDAVKSPTRPLSSASEQSGGSGRLGSSVTRRVHSSPRKPRPVSIAGTVPDGRPPEIKVSPIKRTLLANKKLQSETKKASPVSSQPSTAKANERTKRNEKAKPSSNPAAPKVAKQATAKQATPPKTSSPKTPSAKKAATNKKKADILVSSQLPPVMTANQVQETVKTPTSPPSSPPPDGTAENERNNAKRIISEEEAKTALAEKRRLAREQAEKEAELEKKRLEELRLKEEEELRLEEEEQRRMEEEQLHLLEEHRKVEEEKLRKAIEENERKEEEERAKREEEQRLKAEQEKKAQEEAEKQRLELEEKLRKEEEERAERKKRLEKIMSRTRGKSSNTSPSGSVSGSEQFDSSENQQEHFSSGANSLDSNTTGENNSGPASLECQPGVSEPMSDGTSLEANPAYDGTSDNESLIDIIMPNSETASQDSSLLILPEKDVSIPEKDVSNPIKSQISDFVETMTEMNVENAASSTDSKNEPSFAEKNQLSVETKVQSDENVEDLDKVCNVEDTSNFKVAEVVDETKDPVSSDVAPLEMTAVSAPIEQESSVIDQEDVILQFEESSKTFGDVSMSSFSDESSTLLPDVPQSSEIYAPVQEETDMEHHSHLSTSSDIKLPDPIYETSDEGSVSSEKHQQDCLQDEEPPLASHPISDEVFGEKEGHCLEEANFNPFEKCHIERSSDTLTAYESQFEVGGMQDSIYAYETSEAVPGIVEQPREIEEENVYPTRSSTSDLPEAHADLLGDLDVFQNLEENKENMGNDMMHHTGPLASADSEHDIYADKENLQFTSPHTIPPLYQIGALPEQLNLEINTDKSLDMSVMQKSVIFEQNVENQSLLTLTEDVESSGVTIITAEDSGECIGIISSVEHDQVSNEIVQQRVQNELLKSNFDYCSVTDSEDSSLDSNLSQVMTAEVSENNSIVLSNNEIVSQESSVILNNGEAVNPFERPSMNGSKDFPKANGDHYSEIEALSNGHRFDASDSKLEQIGNYVQLDSKHISSVDDNIFDNVNAVDFGKMSPDPFLAKGSSNQISGNPFLLQEEQVLMTPDFLN